MALIIAAQRSDDLVDDVSRAPARSEPSQPAQPPANDDDDDIYADPPTNQPRLSSGISQLPPSDEEEDDTPVRPSRSISSRRRHALIGGQPQSGSPIANQTQPTSPRARQTEQVTVSKCPTTANPGPAQSSAATHRQSHLTPPPSSPSRLSSPLSSPPEENNRPTKRSRAKKTIQLERRPPSTRVRDKS